LNDLWITVVIPTYNRMESLRLTLDGLARQTLPRDQFEVVVVSDGSTDGTAEFLTKYAGECSFALRSIDQENGGPSRARNRGIAEARGEVIVLLDDDVEPVAEFLAGHTAHHITAKKVAVIGPMLPDPARRRSEPAWIAWEHAMLRKQYENWRTGVWTDVGPRNFYSGNASVRREHVLSVGGFNEEFKRLEDVELAGRMQRDCGVEFVYDAAPIGIHRPHRSLEAWMTIPTSYGRLEVVRARAGDGSWETIRDSYRGRHILTRFLASLTFALPATQAPLRVLLIGIARMCFRAGLTPLSNAALSALYNVAYLQSARAEMGAAEFKKLVTNCSP